MAEIGRLITAMVTPFRPDGSVDYDRARALADALFASGSDGIVVCGTTGEAPTVTDQEKLRLFAEIKKVARDRGTVIANTGTYDTAHSIEMTKEAEAVGVDAALLVVPYYNRPSQEGLYRHFKSIADNTRLNCIIYNVPSRTVADLSAETMLRLSKVPNIIGVKEASGNLTQIGAIIYGISRPNFKVWSGNDSDTLAVIKRGGYGVISVASHIVGRQIRELIRLAVKGDYERAQALDAKLAPLNKALFVTANPIPVKHALNHLGFPVGGLRLPLVSADGKDAMAVEAALQGVTVDLPVPAQKG
jgi:4-hydroxy-tetrahydrodipicolinate synthase